MIAQFGDTKVYHPDELLELTDPVGSVRITCKVLRRLHPHRSEFFFYTNSQYLNQGLFIVEEFSNEYDKETAMISKGTVCMDRKGQPSWWQGLGEEWRIIDDEF